MFIAKVHVHIKQGQIEAFKTATVHNAHHSLHEPGIARFDVLQQQDDPTHFVLLEVYYTENDSAKHKETEHYQTWRETVKDMMQEPRYAVKYNNVFPADEGWESSGGDQTKNIHV
ncbi:MAG: antibiotic biosynthesis monooxygenase [candidate division KSB1 bacterium]|nr:antibiotic biosynthesis monooxygenase [candidate division KSB1 bacterium]